jgi:NAD(P)H-dependent FMN reductase
MLNLKIVIGSTRPGRAADLVIPWITSAARQHGAFEVDVTDLREWQLPLFGETFATVGNPADPTFSVPAVSRWNDKIAAPRRRSCSMTSPGGQRRCSRPGRRGRCRQRSCA